MKIVETLKTENYTWIKVRLNNDDPGTNEVNHWCTTTGCGKLVKKNTFSFKNEKEEYFFVQERK